MSHSNMLEKLWNVFNMYRISKLLEIVDIVTELNWESSGWCTMMCLSEQ